MAMLKQAYGSVLIGIVSPTRFLLVRQKNHSDPYWKIPGGNVEKHESVRIAARNEASEEVGIDIPLEDVVWYLKAKDTPDGYVPHLCVAHISEELFDTRASDTDSDEEKFKVKEFLRSHIPNIPGVLIHHRQFLPYLK